MDDRGRVIVADTGNNRLQLLSFDGRSFGYLRSIAGFAWPTGVWAYGSDRILVADTGANAIKELIPVAGTYIGKIYAPYNAPRGVAADASGRLIVADTGNRRVVTIPGALPTFTPTPSITASPTPTATATPTASRTPTPTPEGDLTLSGLIYDASLGRQRSLPHAHLSADTCQQAFTAFAGPDGRYSLFISGSALNGCSHVAFVATSDNLRGSSTRGSRGGAARPSPTRFRAVAGR